nr:MAG TPA: hypothetical protein [Caudoviricetes sp.]
MLSLTYITGGADTFFFVLWLFINIRKSINQQQVTDDSTPIGISFNKKRLSVWCLVLRVFHDFAKLCNFLAKHFSIHIYLIINHL